MLWKFISAVNNSKGTVWGSVVWVSTDNSKGPYISFVVFSSVWIEYIYLIPGISLNIDDIRYVCCEVNITTAAFNFDSEADVFDYVSKILKQNHPTFGFLPNALPFELLRPDICYPMFLNIGFHSVDILFVKITSELSTARGQQHSLSIHVWGWFGKFRSFLDFNLQLPDSCRKF